VTEPLKRVKRGTLNMTAQVGTLLGPTDITREHLVVMDCQDGVATIGYATQADIEAALVLESGPRSVAEAELRRHYRT
jgi:hypothetical protein